jgi:hypothetical protein
MISRHAIIDYLIYRPEARDFQYEITSRLLLGAGPTLLMTPCR